MEHLRISYLDSSKIHRPLESEYALLLLESSISLDKLKFKKKNMINNAENKLKREITRITNSQYTKKTFGQPSVQLFPKRWPLSNPNRTKLIWTHIR